MNALKVAAIGAEVAIVASTASVAWALIADSDNIRVVAPMIVAATAIEAVRLPLVFRIPKLGPIGRVSALALALAVSAVTTETMILGFEGLLTARAAKVTAAETRRAEAQTSLYAAKADADRQGKEIERLAAGVAAAQAHSEDVGRETVTLQSVRLRLPYPQGLDHSRRRRRQCRRQRARPGRACAESKRSRSRPCRSPRGALGAEACRPQSRGGEPRRSAAGRRARARRQSGSPTGRVNLPRRRREPVDIGLRGGASRGDNQLGGDRHCSISSGTRSR
jgi:hypothetical protein